jgi:hypothetical protein
MNFRNMRKIIFISFVFSFLLFAAGAKSSFACSCMFSDKPLKAQIEEAFDNSTAIFSGKVISVTQKSEYEVAVKIKIEKSWKGASSKEITITTAKDSAMCGYGFEEGKKYLVYTNGEKDALSVSNCSRTTLSSNKEDIKHLDKLKKKRVKTKST